MTKAQIIAKAINTYKDIKAGKVDGIKLAPLKSIKIGSITFIH